MQAGSNLRRVLESGRFAITAEIRPPKHADGSAIRNHAATLRGFVDSINVADNPSAQVRLSSVAAGTILVNAGHDAVVHMSCRDRNRIGLQSDLLGAYALGVRNVLCLTGDHQRLGDHPTAKHVFDLDSVNLIAMVKQLRDGNKFLSGEECQAAPSFYIGCVANPFAEPSDYRVIRLEKKVEAGADFVQTQNVFDLARFAEFMAMVRARGLHKRVKILAGVTPVNSAQTAALLQQGTAGIPGSLVERLRVADNQQAEGIQICIEQIQYLKTVEGVAGVHILAPFAEEIVPNLAERAGLLPRPQFPALD